ncbi:PLC-like phosphodiesterase [Acephala macrosclerotiorum]|nr:PLC-like phosphodiesterase [Acephala macrosclerotiorum]
MSVFDGGSGGASETNTVTQTLSIRDQLKYGARWFDIRPVLASAVWKTGHYDWKDELEYWLGGNEQKIDDIVSQINDFTNGNNKLVIINLSHRLDTDSFIGDKYDHLTQNNWNDLIDKLLGIKHRVTGLSSSVDLSTMLVSDFIKNKPATLIILDDQIEGGAGVEFSTIVSSGFFSSNQLPLYNSYTNTDDLNTMANDQLTKMHNQRPSSQSRMFLLSWTLTQNIGDILNPLFASILDLAAKANVAVYKWLWDNMSSESYPNVVMVDGFEANGDLVALVMAINFHFAGRCVPASTGKKGSMTNAILSVGSGCLI